MVIESFIKSKGIPPTVREIGELVGEKTPVLYREYLTVWSKKE